MKMFKIKDDIDLKVLEQYGFDLRQSLDNGEYYYTNARLFIDNRILKQMDQYNPFMEVDYELDYYEVMIIYELTKSNILEKVEYSYGFMD